MDAAADEDFFVQLTTSGIGNILPHYLLKVLSKLTYILLVTTLLCI